MVMRGCCCPIIPYQEIIGNYSGERAKDIYERIIPYQEIIGNYSDVRPLTDKVEIIPYQEIIGNYSDKSVNSTNDRLYHTKK